MQDRVPHGPGLCNTDIEDKKKKTNASSSVILTLPVGMNELFYGFFFIYTKADILKSLLHIRFEKGKRGSLQVPRKLIVVVGFTLVLSAAVSFLR